MKGRRAPILALLLALLLVLPGCEPLNQALAAPALDEDFSLSDIPAFSGQPYVVVGDNTPQFPEEDLVPVSFEDYSPLDGLGRCGAAYACVSLDTMPTEDRGSIGQVKPSGWHTVRYDCVDGKYLYNRCHLIGYQLTGENANEENLITGTRYMNVEGMLPFEDMVNDYVDDTGGHVLYRVTPIFQGDNLVADGVLMEACSVEDEGAGLSFCVFCYNVQPGVTIDYATGESWRSEEDPPASSQGETGRYVLNTNSMKFHLPSCGSVNQISPGNYQEYSGGREELIQRGYSPCGSCKP